jgi:hypothetical protein
MNCAVLVHDLDGLMEIDFSGPLRDEAYMILAGLVTERS